MPDFSSNNTLSFNDATNNHNGIFLESSGNNTLSDNNASNNNFGIFLDHSSNNILSGNNASNNNWNGIDLYSSSSNTLSGNNASNNDDGIDLYSSSNNNTLTDNDALNNNWNGIELNSSNNNTLNGNNASDNYDGIYLDSSSNNMISGNDASNTNYGIYLKTYSNNNTLIDNNASNNDKGIFLYTSSNNTLSGNIALNNQECGIPLQTFSNNNTLIGNNASNNTYYGIRLWISSDNTLNLNNASNNQEYGINLNASSNNHIYNNYFNNTNNTNFEGTVDANSWNTSQTPGTNIVGGPYIGGNYWAKPDGTGFSQTCNDTDANGLSDEVYNLSINNMDYLPLAVYPPPANEGDSKPPSKSKSRGSRGIFSGEPARNVVVSETYRQYVNKDTSVSFDFGQEGNVVRSISVTAVRTGIIAAKVEILRDTSNPLDKDPSKKVYKSMNIIVENDGRVSDHTIKDSVIEFTVDKPWISDNKIKEDSITMHRYSDDQWNPLMTTEVRRDADHVYFEAVTPGFSTFIISGEMITLSESQKEKETEAKSTEIEELSTVQVPKEKEPGIPGFTLFTGLSILLIMVQLLRKRN